MKGFCVITIICLFVFSLVLEVSAKPTDNKQKKDTIYYAVPGMDNVQVKKNITYQKMADDPLNLDIYYPPGFNFQTQIPAVVVVFGYPDKAAKPLVGSKLKEWWYYISWGKFIAASGMAAIVYETSNPEQDITKVLRFLKSNGMQFAVDKERIGVFSTSGNVPTAVYEILTGNNSTIRCAAFYYGFFSTHDFQYLEQADSLSAKVGFMSPVLPASDSWKKNIPLFIVRAGKDKAPYLNQSLDWFYNKALRQNLPITLINYSEAPHGFDIKLDSPKTQKIIENTLEFWKFHLKVDDFREAYSPLINEREQH